MKDCALFLAGRYLAKDFPYYRKLARGRYRVAVDGGCRYFLRSGTVPDLLIGDFDSHRPPKRVSRRTTVMSYPVDKDRTDTELAVDHCLEAGARRIDIVQPAIGDPDHFLANLFLMTRADVHKSAGQAELRLVGPRFEAFYLHDSSREFLRAGGSILSVIPLSASIRLTCRGTAFDISGARVERGRTRSARNRIRASRASVRVAGRAFLVRLFGKR